MSSAHKKTSTCAVLALLRTRCSVRAPHIRVLDPTQKVGLQAPNVCWLPAGTPSVRQKDRQVTNTAEVMEAVADFHHQFIIFTEVRQAFHRGRFG